MKHSRYSANTLRPFILLTFGFSWTIWFLLWISRDPTGGESTEFWWLLLSSIGPLIAAVYLTWKEKGRARLGSLFGLTLKYRVDVLWYLVILIPMAAATVSSGVLALLFHRELTFAQIAPYRLVGSFLLMFIYAMLTEEIGWRGFLLPRLQSRFTALQSSLILGFLWGAWHLPLWALQPERSHGRFLVLSMIVFVAGTIATSVLLTFIFNGTQGSILIVSMYHGSSNTLAGWIDVGDGRGQMASLVAYTFVMILIAGFIVWRFGADSLSPLGRVRSMDNPAPNPESLVPRQNPFQIVPAETFHG